MGYMFVTMHLLVAIVLAIRGSNAHMYTITIIIQIIVYRIIAKATPN